MDDGQWNVEHIDLVEPLPRSIQVWCGVNRKTGEVRVSVLQSSTKIKVVFSGEEWDAAVRFVQEFRNGS